MSTRIELGYVYTRAIVPNLPHLHENETLVVQHASVNLFTSQKHSLKIDQMSQILFYCQLLKIDQILLTYLQKMEVLMAEEDLAFCL